MPGILQRYVLLELLRVFGLALTAITGILVMAGIVAEASQQGLGPEQIIKLLPLLIPETLPYTIPATTLFAVSVVYGRLSNDNEITAIKAAGIPISKVLWPALWIGLGVSVVVYALYVEFIPRCHHLLRTTPLKDLEDIIYMRLRRDQSFSEPKCNYEIFVKGVQGRRLIGATFKRRDAAGNFEIVAQAREAKLRVDLENKQIEVTMLHGEIQKNNGQTDGNFEREVFYVQMPDIDPNRQVRAREKTNAEILEREAELLLELQELQQTCDEQREHVRKAADAEQRRKEQDALDPMIYQGTFKKKELWELRTEYATRPALSLGCFFFVLIGCPVAIWFQRRDYLSAFVTCFLPIIVVYYPLIMLGINLGKEGRVLPQYMMWTGDAVMGAVGLLLLWRLGRR